MKKIFGAKKSQDPPPSIQDATDRIYKRGDTWTRRSRSWTRSWRATRSRSRRPGPDPRRSPSRRAP
uniref:Uncharacterized protein n=1 Tax=Aegilops tauschii subsp. strangulata TaxID=200361 RepID=A0A452ZFU2_AEGTS